MNETNENGNKHGEWFCCTRIRMLDYLVGKGYQPERVTADLKNPRFKNWIFRTSDAFNQDVTAYFAMAKARKEQQI